MGLRSASTTCEVAMLVELCGNIAPASGRLAATSTHRLESGTQTSGRGPSRAGSHDGPSAAATSLEPLSTTVAPTHAPFTCGCVSVHVRARSPSAVKWVADAAMVMDETPFAHVAAVGRDRTIATETIAPTTTRPTVPHTTGWIQGCRLERWVTTVARLVCAIAVSLEIYRFQHGLSDLLLAGLPGREGG
jgi:hypothetical protein